MSSGSLYTVKGGRRLWRQRSFRWLCMEASAGACRSASAPPSGLLARRRSGEGADRGDARSWSARFLTRGPRADPRMALTYQRLWQVRRWSHTDEAIIPLIQRAWQLRPPAHLRRHHSEAIGPIGLVQQEIHALGWDWEESPWAFRRPSNQPVALAGAPNGAFSHATREGTRNREFARAVARRPELEGVERVDRRAVFAALKWGA